MHINYLLETTGALIPQYWGTLRRVQFSCPPKVGG
jgi:hypothetical protein